MFDTEPVGYTDNRAQIARVLHAVEPKAELLFQYVFRTGKINQNQKRPEDRLRSGEAKSENFVFICLYVRLALSLR